MGSRFMMVVALVFSFLLGVFADATVYEFWGVRPLPHEKEWTRGWREDWNDGVPRHFAVTTYDGGSDTVMTTLDGLARMYDELDVCKIEIVVYPYK